MALSTILWGIDVIYFIIFYNVAELEKLKAEKQRSEYFFYTHVHLIRCKLCRCLSKQMCYSVCYRTIYSDFTIWTYISETLS